MSGMNMSNNNNLRPPTRTRSDSPTSSTSSQTTTPTSPQFRYPYSTHPYAASTVTEARPSGSNSSLGMYNPSLHASAPSPPLFHAPPGMTYHGFLKSWGQPEIVMFLNMYKCGQYAMAFKQNDISGKVLLDLDLNSLKEMGIAKVGERVKLMGGIKELRKKVAASGPMRAPSRVELRLNGAATPSLDDGNPGLSPVLDAGQGIGARTGMAAARRLNSTRPPPLDLQPHQSSRPLPQNYQHQPNTASTATSHRSNTARPTQSRPSLASTSSSSATITPASSVPAPSKSNLNLRAPTSNVGRRSPSPIGVDAANFMDRPLPPAPNQQSSAAEYASSITQQRVGATPTWSQSSDPQSSSRNPAPLPTEKRTATAALRVDHNHRKSPSVTSSNRQPSPVKQRQPRPIPAVHPFAAGRDDRRPSPPPNDALNSSHKRYPPGGFVVGSGGMAGGKSSSSGSRKLQDPSKSPSLSHSQSLTQLPLEDIRRQVVKFINVQDGTTRTVAVASCGSGVEVLEKVLKKFGKWNTNEASVSDADSEEEADSLEVDGWGVYAESDPDDDSKPLSEADLLGICMSHRDGTVIREKGLVLRRKRKNVNRKNMEVFFGETPPPPMSPTSPTYFGGPRLGITAKPEPRENRLLTPQKASRKLNRASTVSIMSGLGAPILPSDIPPSPTTARSPSSASFLAQKGKKMYNFFGHRPPSELISNHLAEYFPAAKRRELEKTVRHSVTRLSTGPMARNSIAPSESRMSLDVPGDRLGGRRGSALSVYKVSPPRKIRPHSRITISSPPPAGIIPEEIEEMLPTVSVSNDGGQMVRPQIDGESDGEISSRPPLLPPFESSGESLSDSLQSYSPVMPSTSRQRPVSMQRRNSAGSTRSRISMMSTLRRSRDKSDTASLLTVDEITAEVEHRRASTITFEDSDEEEAIAPALTVDPLVPTDEDEEESDEEEEDETEEEESDEEEEEVEEDTSEAEHGRAFTSAGSKRSIKWIKGALIGAGSFGSVYLGMDAHNGLLMAVKQVSLPTGGEKDEERKSNMVVALEREIELLKELQHENIVQYLDSSADETHLNIFLEYVPGGSVAALLNNYGAFEEALVRNFVRQILMGLSYLHEKGIIHRDIKGANILVDNKGGIKISDFGISKKMESNLMTGLKANRPSLQGSVFWMAPEIVKQTEYSNKADIWSVGCLVVEMLTGTHPWADLTQMQAIFKIGTSVIPVVPNDISPEATDFLSQTFELDHVIRPSGVELLDHPFIAAKDTGMISVTQAQATMAAAQKAAQGVTQGMQSLSALAEAR